MGRVEWDTLGLHNVRNALMAIAAARHTGVIADHAVAALSQFRGVKRRMEVRGEVNGITVYDDFAHHPTAIATTLQGLRRRVGSARILVAFEARSNTMRMGVHRTTLAPAFREADQLYLYQAPEMRWGLEEVAAALGGRAHVCSTVEAIVAELVEQAMPGDHIIVMSNGAFGCIHQKLLNGLSAA
ncbi:MAG: UDP-N-acetylmuramate:L-alanyl-gamma-D-glutamyl-meso-diaminopimelate ligase [Halothiobacillaceae bacterium]|nr:MAG: UDP-N-acetylmuramate:L-alanyl-gamma-D-glutamyl-meso-diaminopimelate ligase [Halothiobacillaceae bacterium]